ncbi:hypothetical protein AOQ73_27930 [Bradyrhizobium pachyrhizi]|uniref:hypothetical protein n=1 Tax=Bradyrhizobium pachyrhizi TaxID=280333 RepID=UPI00070567C1|nr:hypothetical protein [Bradyrhizobium pachyrhizi]KRP88635.1 hypothetical protein AOQ73_27930 [Bradyrhizobium pachyrhizi]
MAVNDVGSNAKAGRYAEQVVDLAHPAEVEMAVGGRGSEPRIVEGDLLGGIDPCIESTRQAR